MSEDKQPTWAKVELMGHICLAGILGEEERFGSKIGRIDIPSGDGFTTQYFGGSAVYRISIVTEEVARQIARQSPAAPVGVWDYPKRIEHKTVATRDTDELGPRDYGYPDDDDDPTDDEDQPY